MNLHLPTLFIIMILVDLMMLSMFAFASYIKRSQSTLYWAAGLLVHCAALALAMVQMNSPSILGFVLPSVLASSAYMLMTLSFATLLEFHALTKLVWLPTLVMLIASPLLIHDIHALLIASGFISAIQFSIMLYMLGSRWDSIKSGGIYFMGASLFAVIAVFYFRSSWMLNHDVTAEMMRSGEIMLTLPYLIGIVATVGISGGMLMILRDCMGEKLQENQHFINEIANNIPSIIFQFCLRSDGTSYFPYVNSRVRTLGVDKRELEEDSEQIFAKVHSDDYANVQKSMMQSAKTLGAWNMQFRLRNSSGQYRWHEAKSIPERKPDGSVLWYGYMHDIQEMKDAEDKIRQMVVHDGLTGLANRSLLESHMRSEIAHAERTQSNFCLMFLDMDNFKYINDRFGHGIGDRLLQEFSKRLTMALRKSDFVARVGGDEFVILLRGLRQPDRILAISEKIFETITEPYQIDGNVMKASASIGAAIYPEHGLDLTALERSADQAMYDSKRRGENIITIFQGNDRPRVGA